MIIRNRYEEIYELKKAGLTFKEIAKKYSISGTMARHIYIKIREFKENYDSYPPLRKLLPTLTQRGLIHWFDDVHILEHPEKIIAKIKFSDISKRVPCIGKIGASKLSQALIDLGYLKPDDQWLKE